MQTGTFPFNIGGNGIKGYPQYFSRKLFDCDSTNIEYIVYLYDPIITNPTFNKVFVFRTDGSILFAKDSVKAQTVGGWINIPDHYIQQTSQGAKLILRHENGKETFVYSLCGNLPTGINTENNEVLSQSNLYPNPTNDYFMYEFDKNLLTNGKIVVSDISGKEIYTANIDNTFGKVYVNTLGWALSQYIITLYDEYNIIKDSKKFIVSK